MGGTKAIAASLEADDEIADQARELSSLRDGTRTPAETRAEVASGLARLAETASRRGQARISRACKALSAILSRVGQEHEEDADFILSTTLHFLDALQAKRVHTGREAA